MMVFISNGKTTCFSLQRPSSGFDNFLAKRVLYISCQNLKMAAIGRNMQFFPLLINNIIQRYIYSCVLTEFTSPYSLNTQWGWQTSEIHYFTNLFWYKILHVSDRFTEHHQEFSTVYTSIRICHTGYSNCLVEGSE